MQDTLIQRQVTADRGGGGILVTTQDVMQCIASLPTETFTTWDIVEAIKAAHPCVQYHRLEYACRQSVAWLARRGKVRAIGAAVRKSKRCPLGYLVMQYREVPEPGAADFATLYRALGMCQPSAPGGRIGEAGYTAVT